VETGVEIERWRQLVFAAEFFAKQPARCR